MVLSAIFPVLFGVGWLFQECYVLEAKYHINPLLTGWLALTMLVFIGGSLAVIRQRQANTR